MAKMIPTLDAKTLSNINIGEKLAYESLMKISDAIVFHSVNWNSIRNGRLAQGEGDFVVYLPGSGVIVIEVKSSNIRFSDGKWYQENRYHNSEHEIDSPLHQANRTKFELIKLFKEKNINVSVISAVWFPNSKGIEGQLPMEYNEALVFLNRDLNNPKKALLEAFKFSGFRNYTADKLLTSQVIDCISPRFSVFTNGQGIIDEHNFHFNRMTMEQTRILDFLVEQNEASIVGGAGTGKTVLAIEKAKRLSLDGPVLFICFNRFLAQNLRVRLSNYSDIEVHNPQSLFYHFNKNANLGIEELTWDHLNNFLVEIQENEWMYKHIVIDEGQDIDSDFILLLKGLCNMDEFGFFYVFYDKNQMVQNIDELSWRKKIPCQLVLTTNCRNTVNIAKTSHSVLKLDKLNVKSDIDGSQSNLYRVNNQDKIEDRVAKIIKKHLENGYQLDDITVLTLKKIEESILANVSRVGSYSLSVDKKVGRSILFTTARKFKGLESNIVILVDIDKSTFENKINPLLFYVATSRAKVHLDLIFLGDDKAYLHMISKFLSEETRYPKAEFIRRLNIKVI